MNEELSKKFHKDISSKSNIKDIESFYKNNSQLVNEYLKGENCQETPLCISVINGHLDLAEFFISFNNIDLNKGGIIGGGKYSPLSVAVEFGKIECVKLLLKNGANINETCSSSWFPLYLSVEYKQYDILKYLLEFKELNLNLKGYHGTALDLAKKMNLKEYQSILEERYQLQKSE